LEATIASTRPPHRVAEHEVALIVEREQPAGPVQHHDDWLVRHRQRGAPSRRRGVPVGCRMQRRCTTKRAAPSISPLRSYPSLPPTYFEVGNEPNLPIKETPKYNGFQNYAERFYYATTGLYRALNTTYSGQKKAGAYYRILTGGVKSPDGEKGCKSGTIGEIALAIQKARANGPHGSVPTTNLGVAVHPYGFTTSSFKNYFAAHGNKSNICGNLGAMNRAWLDRFPNLPLVYTEINYSPGGSTNPLLQGSYLTDVMTYLYDTRSQQSTNTSTPYIVSGYDRLRVWWQEFIDTSGSATGLYTSGGTTTNKSFKVATCTNKTIHGGTSYVEPQVYFYLQNGHCY